eukprot:XP_014773693.1 PREDICTED: craniofacial development protein 2-like [Octopus bimaculoides]
MKGRSVEIVEMMEHCHVDVYGVQKVRSKGASVRFLIGEKQKFKFFWVGRSDGVGSVGILVVEKWVDKVIEVVRVCDRFIKLRLIINRLRVTFISAYAPLTGLANDQKDQFDEVLLQTTSTTNDRDFVIVAGNFNGHVGQLSHGFHVVLGSYGFGTRNEEGTKLLEFCDANDLQY